MGVVSLPCWNILRDPADTEYKRLAYLWYSEVTHLINSLLVFSSRTKPMGGTLALGPQASLSSRCTRTLLSMGQKFSAASSSWPKAWRKSWRTRGATWIPKMFHFTRSSGTPSPRSTCSQCAWRKFTVENALQSHPHPKCPSMRLRGSSGVTHCWRQPETIWTGWSISLGFKFQRSKGKNVQLLGQHVRGTLRGVDTSCNFLTQADLSLWCRHGYGLWQLFFNGKGFFFFFLRFVNAYL